MTQILAALTQEYVLVASDRQLTIVSGPRNGQIHDDDTCKLVLLCGIWGIAYKKAPTLRQELFLLWRRGGDSNSRSLARQQISSLLNFFPISSLKIIYPSIIASYHYFFDIYNPIAI